jgi:nucleoside-diphosphate-sugar epimerase
LVSSAFVTGGSGFIGGALIRRLVAEGWSVRALVRSDSSGAIVERIGAEPVRGHLGNAGSLRSAATGCEFAFHAAAQLGEWGSREDFIRDNVDGTRNTREACADAGVRRFVHVGTEAALLAGKPLVEVDETAPLRPDSKALYPATKAMAEQAVLDANTPDFETVVVRPRLVWGPGDTSVLPALVELIDKGRFAWIGGGRHLTSTAHIDNTVEGLMLGAERGTPGNAYFVTDGDPVVFRDFVTEWVATQGVEAPRMSIPVPVARAFAATSEGIWKTFRLKSAPPMTRLAFWLSAFETTIDITKARTELGYEPVRTIEDGMAELRQEHASAAP